MGREYPDHIYNENRIEIASELIEHEMRKLLPSINGKENWDKVQQNILDWFSGQNSGLASVHDFWNGFEGIMLGFKLKMLLPYLTAENITWQLKDVPLLEIIVPWADHILPKKYFSGNKISGQEIIDKISSDSSLKNEIRKGCDYHSNYPVGGRNYYPVILLDTKDNHKTLDGNRRVITAIVNDQKNIKAWVAKISDDSPLKNYWISTGLLRNLSATSQINFEDGNLEIAAQFKEIIKYYITSFPIAKVNFDKRVREKFGFVKDL